MSKRPEFTHEQEEYICNAIGEWYLEWKGKLIDWKDKTHKLGYATEKLKDKLRGVQNENDFLEALKKTIEEWTK